MQTDSYELACRDSRTAAALMSLMDSFCQYLKNLIKCLSTQTLSTNACQSILIQTITVTNCVGNVQGASNSGYNSGNGIYQQQGSSQSGSFAQGGGQSGGFAHGGSQSGGLVQGGQSVSGGQQSAYYQYPSGGYSSSGYYQ